LSPEQSGKVEYERERLLGIDDSSYRGNFDLGKKNEIHYHSWKLQSLVANCCKMRKIQLCEVRKLCLYLFALRAGKITIFEPKVVIFTGRNTNI
jgi:hypothetical protein